MCVLSVSYHQQLSQCGKLQKVHCKDGHWIFLYNPLSKLLTLHTRFPSNITLSCLVHTVYLFPFGNLSRVSRSGFKSQLELTSCELIGGGGWGVGGRGGGGVSDGFHSDTREQTSCIHYAPTLSPLAAYQAQRSNVDRTYILHTVKKVSDILSREYVNYSPVRVSLVSDIPAGDGKINNLFYSDLPNVTFSRSYQIIS